MKNKKNKPILQKMDISGKWLVAELPDMEDDYLDLSPHPQVVLKREIHGGVVGEYEFGAQNGMIDGRLARLTNDRVRLSFSFEGNDEIDPVHGYGEAFLVDENTLNGYMHYHLGDTYRFIWTREQEELRFCDDGQ